MGPKLLEAPMKFLKKLATHKRGATAIEYGLIAALIAVAAIGAMAALGGKLSNTFSNVSNNMNVS
jgi:pilus assembly protein Flp/PilA